jgi:hypothetical protein
LAGESGGGGGGETRPVSSHIETRRDVKVDVSQSRAHPSQGALNCIARGLMHMRQVLRFVHTEDIRHLLADHQVCQRRQNGAKPQGAGEEDGRPNRRCRLHRKWGTAWGAGICGWATKKGEEARVFERGGPRPIRCGGGEWGGAASKERGNGVWGLERYLPRRMSWSGEREGDAPADTSALVTIWRRGRALWGGTVE